MTCLQEFHLGSESEPWLGRGRAKCSVVSGEVRAAAALALRTPACLLHTTHLQTGSSEADTNFYALIRILFEVGD